MKIIKEGDPEILKKTKRFKCENCGCEFEADEGEYKSFVDSFDLLFYRAPRETYYQCKCPFCKANVTLKQD